MRLPTSSLRRIAKGKDPKAAFYFALAYLLWSIVPHFHVLIHSHAGGAHSHAELDGAQVRLANRVLEGLGPAGFAASADGELSGQESPSRSAAGVSAEEARPSLPPGETALAAGGDAGLHAHFWEDTNLAGTAPFPAFALACAVALLFLAARYLPPALSPAGAAPARGPPAFLFA